ncbi:MAG TPA: hypothetical protein VE465_10710 [Streptosporangiaceae bacterium]|jgi:hypothetical protein|nr:hypothetical protein [Streptosporangiaceae bacterium]
MGLQIPGELADLLNELGYTWPKSDETKLVELGRHWMDYGGKVQGLVGDAEGGAGRVWPENAGQAIEAFRAKWDGENSALAVTRDGATGAQVVGAALFVCAAIVLALKINVIVQLTILLIEIIQAIATAAPTFGASLLEIPVFKKLADIAINLIINQAMEAILG